jgi:hypothetical protein
LAVTWTPSPTVSRLRSLLLNVLFSTSTLLTLREAETNAPWSLLDDASVGSMVTLRIEPSTAVRMEMPLPLPSAARSPLKLNALSLMATWSMSPARVSEAGSPISVAALFPVASDSRRRPAPPLLLASTLVTLILLISPLSVMWAMPSPLSLTSTAAAAPLAPMPPWVGSPADSMAWTLVQVISRMSPLRTPVESVSVSRR